MVEFVAVEVKAADQRTNGTILRVDRNKGGFHFRQLGNLPVALVVLVEANNRAALQALVGRGLVVEHLAGKFHGIAGQRDDFSTFAVHLDLFRIGGQNECWLQVACLGGVLQRLVDGFVLIVRGDYTPSEFEWEFDAGCDEDFDVTEVYLADSAIDIAELFEDKPLAIAVLEQIRKEADECETT